MSELGSDRRAARRAERDSAASSRREPQRGQAPAEKRTRSNFFSESLAELKKVEWPNQNQVIQGTVVVLIACLVVGTYLYINDTIWKHVVSKVFLGQ